MPLHVVADTIYHAQPQYTQTAQAPMTAFTARRMCFRRKKSLWFLRNTTCQGRCISQSVWDWMPMVLRRRIFPIKGQPKRPPLRAHPAPPQTLSWYSPRHTPNVHGRRSSAGAPMQLSVYIGAGRGIWYQRLHGAAYSRAHSFIRGGAEAGCGLYSGAGLQGA